MSCRQITTISVFFSLQLKLYWWLEYPAPSVVGREVDVIGRRCTAESRWVAPVRAPITSSPNGRRLRRQQSHCYLEIFLLLGLGSFTWRSRDGIWARGKSVGGGRKQTTTAWKAGNTHGGGHLVQLAHGLVDSSFQVIIQFAWSVDDRAQVTWHARKLPKILLQY